MVDFMTPLSLWVQLGSFFFFMSGIFGDLLVIRFFLVLAYVMLFINAVLGSPLWPDVKGQDHTFALDSICWALIGLYVHGCSMWCLLLDERKVPLNDDEAALWRMFYRTGGLSQRLFHDIVAKYLKVVEFKPGQEIPTNDDFYIIYKGQVKLEVFNDDDHKYDRIMLSGEMFDLNFLGLFSDKTLFERTRIKCRSITATKLFRIHRDDMQIIAKNRLAKGIWQALLINQLSFIVESYAERSPMSRKAEEVHDRIFEPLEPWELPPTVLAGSGTALQQTLTHLVHYIRVSFSPPLPFAGHPTGIRQTQLPPPPQRGTYEQPDRMPRFHVRKLLSQRLTGRSTSSVSLSDTSTDGVRRKAAGTTAANSKEVPIEDSGSEQNC